MGVAKFAGHMGLRLVEAVIATFALLVTIKIIDEALIWKDDRERQRRIRR